MSKLVSSTYHTRTYDTGKVVLKKEWVNERAGYTYRLYRVYKTHTDGWNGGRERLHYVTQGNYDWATKTAEHYGVKIEEVSA